MKCFQPVWLLLCLGILTACGLQKPESFQEFTLEPSQLLPASKMAEAAEVLRQRMDAISVWPPEVELTELGTGIRLQVYSEESPKMIRSLLTQPGRGSIVPTVPGRQLWETLQAVDSIPTFAPLIPNVEPYQFQTSHPLISYVLTADTADAMEVFHQYLPHFSSPISATWSALPVTSPEGDWWELIAVQSADQGLVFEKEPLASWTEPNAYDGTEAVALEFGTQHTKRWAHLTEQNIDQHLAILIDGRVYSYPIVNDAITGGRTMIAGKFTREQARTLAVLLRFGSLPSPFSIISEGRRSTKP